MCMVLAVLPKDSGGPYTCNPSVSHLVPVLRSFMSEFFNQEHVDHAVPHTPGTSSTIAATCPPSGCVECRQEAAVECKV